jgi:hypothetical protein
MEGSKMKRRDALLSVGTILSILGALPCGVPASASPTEERSVLSTQGNRQSLRLAQFRSKKDPEPDPGGLPGARPGTMSDPDVQRGYRIERDEYRAKRGIDTIEKKPEGKTPDKAIQGIK